MSQTPYDLAMAVIWKNQKRKKHAHRLVWSCLPKGQNFNEKQIMSRRPYGLAVAIIGKKRKNKKNHARHLVWPWFPMGQNLMEKPKMSGTLSGLAVISIRQKKDENWKKSCMPSSLAGALISKRKGRTKKFIPKPLGLSFASHLFWTSCRLHARQLRV